MLYLEVWLFALGDDNWVKIMKTKNLNPLHQISSKLIVFIFNVYIFS